MKTIDLDFKCTNFDGKEIPGDTAAVVVAELLCTGTGGDYVKQIYWAKTLYEKGKIDLDPSDYEKFKGILENTERLINIVKHQIMEAVKNATDSTT